MSLILKPSLFASWIPDGKIILKPKIFATIIALDSTTGDTLRKISNTETLNSDTLRKIEVTEKFNGDTERKLKNNENFVEYEELADIYIEAVVASDHGFLQLYQNL